MTTPAPELLGNYKAPLFRYGDKAVCALRGTVEIVGLSGALVPWPIGKLGRRKALVLFADLTEAVQHESPEAVAHWWGASLKTVWRWRTALGLAGEVVPDAPSGPKASAAPPVPKLLGTYTPPALKRGDEATCLFRDCDVVVTGWTDERISWPRCRPVGVPRSHPSLLVDEELARAIQHESAAALRHWWGVSVGVVWRWRKAFGIDHTGTEGSAILVRAAAQLGADAMKEKEWTDEERHERSRIATEKGFVARLQAGYQARRWTAEELTFLGRASDEAVAALLDRTKEAVRIMRTRRGIPNPRDRRRSPTKDGKERR